MITPNASIVKNKAGSITLGLGEGCVGVGEVIGSFGEGAFGVGEGSVVVDGVAFRVSKASNDVAGDGVGVDEGAVGAAESVILGKGACVVGEAGFVDSEVLGSSLGAITSSSVKFAPIYLSPSIITALLELLPLASPLQLLNSYPGAALAVSTTSVSSP